MEKFCRNCGSPIKENAKFCTSCGAKIPGSDVQNQKTSTDNQTTGYRGAKTYQRIERPAPAAPVRMSEMHPDNKNKKEKKSRKGCSRFLLVILLGVFVFTGFFKPGFIKNLIPVSMPDCFNAGSIESASVAGPTEIGSLKENGYSLTIGDGAFEDGSEVTLKVLSEEERSEIVKTIQTANGKPAFDVIGSVVSLTCDNYDGTYFREPVTLQMKVPAYGIKEKDLGLYYAAYYDEELGRWIYYQPDYVDPDSGIMQVSVGHFSDWLFGKLTPEEAKEKFLTDYSMMQAQKEHDNEEAAAALLPYIKENLEKTDLSAEARNNLANVLVSEFAGAVDGAYADWKEAGGASLSINDKVGRGSTIIALAQSANKAEQDGALAFADGMASFMAEKTMSIILERNGKDLPLVGKAIASSSSFARAAGLAAGNDYPGAVREVMDTVFTWTPGLNVTTAVMKYVSAKCNESYQNWKSNEIENLYQIYKNGYTNLFNTYSIPARDEEMLWTYIDSQKGGVERIYEMDSIAKICYTYGWSESDYRSMSPDKQAIFTSRAKEGLMNYFRTRLACEDRAAAIKAEEKTFIDEIQSEVLCGATYKKFFGEKSYKDFDMTKRLNMIYQIRMQLKAYADEDKMKKNGYSWGEVVKQFIMQIDYNGEDKGFDNFFEYLKKAGILKDGLDEDSEYPTLSEVEGCYFLYITMSDFSSQLSDTLTSLFGEGAVTNHYDSTTSYELFYSMTVEGTGGDKVKLEIYHEYEGTGEYEYQTYTGTYKDGKISVKLKENNAYVTSAEGLTLKKIDLDVSTLNGVIQVKGTEEFKSFVASATCSLRGNWVDPIN